MQQVPPFGQVPVLGQQQRQAQQGIMQAVHSLALGIYSRMAAEYLYESADADAERLHRLAKHSLAAARAYFEGLGVAQFDQEPKP